MAIDGPALVKLVTTVIDAVNTGDRERSVDGMRQLARCSVTTSLLLSTGAGKKARSLPSPPPRAPAGGIQMLPVLHLLCEKQNGMCILRHPLQQNVA